MWNQGVVIKSISKSILTAPWKCFRWGKASRRAAFRPGRVGQSAPELFIRSYTVKANHASKAARFPNTIQDGQTTCVKYFWSLSWFSCVVLVFAAIHVFTWNFMRSRDLIPSDVASLQVVQSRKTKKRVEFLMQKKMNVSSLSSSSTRISHHIRC